MEEKLKLIDKYKKHLEFVERTIEKYEKYNGNGSANLIRYLKGREYVLKQIILDLNDYNI